MPISVFELFKIGIGPSSSHTVGPMRAARQFLLNVEENGHLAQVHRVKTELYGSLALTGEGHGTPKAVILGLLGHTPEEIDPLQIEQYLADVETTSQMALLGTRSIGFVEGNDLVSYPKESLDFHANGMTFTALDENQNVLSKENFYSVGGGFIVDEKHAQESFHDAPKVEIPYPFESAKDLVHLCEKENLNIVELIHANEKVWRNEAEIEESLERLWQVMQDCVYNGTHNTGVLPGGLKVLRRAPKIFSRLEAKACGGTSTLSDMMDWVNLFALAVNEENASGGKVVTAPTNGAAGVIPAVMHYYHKFVKPFDKESLATFLFTAGAIGILFKKGASISAAEVGCQGEIGVACSMAAGALTATLGGSVPQVTNAAEIGMEHNLGLTCDPIGGLVQIPCIERNTMGSIQAINSSNLALQGDGTHKVSLDEVIATMLRTGKDMRLEYKETSLGGLAVNVIEC